MIFIQYLGDYWSSDFGFQRYSDISTIRMGSHTIRVCNFSIALPNWENRIVANRKHLSIATFQIFVFFHVHLSVKGIQYDNDVQYDQWYEHSIHFLYTVTVYSHDWKHNNIHHRNNFGRRRSLQARFIIFFCKLIY